MASYLSTLVIGNYRVVDGEHAGRPMITAVAASLPATGGAAGSLAQTGEIADFLASRFGPYPFDSYGGIAVDDDRISYALETQSRPVYGPPSSPTTAQPGRGRARAGPPVVRRQCVPRRWRDIWLNEGWAEYSSWLWTEARGGTTTQEAFDEVLAIPADDDFWTTVVSDPGRDHLFADAVYERGAVPPCTRCGRTARRRCRPSPARADLGQDLRRRGGDDGAVPPARRAGQRSGAGLVLRHLAGHPRQTDGLVGGRSRRRWTAGCLGRPVDRRTRRGPGLASLPSRPGPRLPPGPGSRRPACGVEPATGVDHHLVGATELCGQLLGDRRRTDFRVADHPAVHHAVGDPLLAGVGLDLGLGARLRGERAAVDADVVQRLGADLPPRLLLGLGRARR